MKLLDGKIVAENIYVGIRKDLKKILSFGRVPTLVAVLVGENEASLSYIQAKKNKAAKLGIDFELARYGMDLSKEGLCRQIKLLNRTKEVRGIIIQLPLPEKYDRMRVLDCVLPDLDIDGLTSASQKKLLAGRPVYIPPAAAAILALLEFYKISLRKKKILIVGAGELVGKPLLKLLRQKGIASTIANHRTEDITSLTKKADVIITGVGKPNLIRGDMVKKGVVIVDAGTSFVEENGKAKLTGDVNFKEVSSRASWITPVPGGVGPLTVAMLYKNFLKSCKRHMLIKRSVKIST